jgi:predicted nucleic acid-binding protein
MNKILVDTNIVLDLLAKREPFYDSAAALFTLADKNKVRLAISSLSVANTIYVLSRNKSAKEAREILRRFKVLVRVLNLNDKIIDLALADGSFKDFKDGLQYYSAIENNLELILTRNPKDFKSSKLPVMSADEFISFYKRNVSG